MLLTLPLPDTFQESLWFHLYILSSVWKCGAWPLFCDKWPARQCFLDLGGCLLELSWQQGTASSGGWIGTCDFYPRALASGMGATLASNPDSWITKRRLHLAPQEHLFASKILWFSWLWSLVLPTRIGLSSPEECQMSEVLGGNNNTLKGEGRWETYEVLSWPLTKSVSQLCCLKSPCKG